MHIVLTTPCVRSWHLHGRSLLAWIPFLPSSLCLKTYVRGRGSVKVMHTPEKNNNRGSLLFICALRLSLPLSLTTLNPYALWVWFGFRLEGTTAFNRSFHGNLNTYMHTYTHVRGKRAGLNSPNCSLTQKVIRWTLWELKRCQSTLAKTGILDWKAIKLYFILSEG